ncbi:Gfo/Idh/MocA family oxidoreductase [Clostridia bacterium]|nr:Gfo/Idh/MocA family oxidoreductase [Clostridia bacterium]
MGLKAGIIGCGGIANTKHMPALKKLKNVEISAFWNLSPERARKACAEFGGEYAKVYNTYGELINSDVDVVYVLTPNKSHAAISIAALEAGKHVMCEKPMATTYADAFLMYEAAEKSGKILSIGYQNRFRPDTRYLKNACVRGDLGEVYFAKAHAIRRRGVPTWGVFLDKEEQGGGPLIDTGTHALDLTLWLMDNYDVKSVRGNVYKKLADRPDCANRFGAWNPDKFGVEDSAFAFITMKNGATVTLESAWAINLDDESEAQTTLCGTKAGAATKGGLVINGDAHGRLYTSVPDLTSGGDDFYDGKQIKTDADIEAESFINAVLTNTEPVVTAKQALTVTRILEAIYTSSEEGREIVFL